MGAKLVVMPLFCEVALPVPLDRTFTYAVGGAEPVPQVGARVLVPFSGQRLSGIVVSVHDRAPSGFDAKPLQQVLDERPLLPDDLMRLATWIAAYYVAPLGEVLRGMLPLAAEVRRHLVYRIADQGRAVLYEGAAMGSSRRSKLPVKQQDREYAVLNYLEAGDPARSVALRTATGADKALLEGMVRKRWLTRETVAEERDARRMERFVVLQEITTGQNGLATEADTPLRAITTPNGGPRLPRLNENQLTAMAEVAAAGGRLLLRALRHTLAETGVPASTVATLVRRGLLRMEEAEQHVDLGGIGSAPRSHEHVLNPAQARAVATLRETIQQQRFAPYLLFGVTGSGKTAVYLAAMREVLACGRGAILLVPEIGLTPAMVGQVMAAFAGEVALLHSGLTAAERAQQWHRIRRGEARIVVGTRSAVFAPVRDLGLILVDEEHDGSYKQEETPRYHGRDTAVMRAKLAGATVVLGSATPSLESWHNAERGRYTRIDMLERVADRPLPDVELVDMRAEFRETGAEQIFSRQLIEQTQATLDRGEQAIILLNRRGYSFVVLCRTCGEKVECENCAVALTYHKHGSQDELQIRPGQRLECHYCGFRRSVPKTCPKCGSEHLHFLGAGSQQGEERLLELFPGARIGRMDRDTVRTRGDMERLLSRLHSGEINLLVGTQMIAKGHDIHGVTLVGVVGADFALGMPDFRAAERVFQLLTQVSGRAGRGDRPGRVLVQTYHPEHYAVRFAQQHDYPGFAAKELQYRRWMHYPPFTSLANVVVQSDQLEQALMWSGQIGRWFEQASIAGLRVLGPAAAPIVRLKRIFRYHFVLKAERRQTLQTTLRSMLAFADGQGITRKNLLVDVDAVHWM